MCKKLSTNILVEKDIDGGFVLSVPGVKGLHADGKTIEEALKNLEEVTSLLNDFHGQKKFQATFKMRENLFGILNYSFHYA